METTRVWNRRVLIVDDRAEIHDDFEEMLASGRIEPELAALGDTFASQSDVAFLPEFELSHAMSGEDAYDMICGAKDADHPFALAYIDVRMPPGMDGIETVRRIRKIDQALEVVVMTAYTDMPLSEIVNDMALPHKLLYIRKPFAREEIQQVALSLVEKWNIEAQLTEKQRQLITDHQRLEAVLDATGDAIGMYDASGRLLVANRWYERLCDATESQLMDMSPDELTALIEARFRKPALPAWGRRMSGAVEGSLVEEAARAGVSNPRRFYRSIAPVQDDRQTPMGRIYVYRDVSKEIEIEQLKSENLRLRSELETTHTFEGMVGASMDMQSVYALIRRAAESDITVLIQGESGTGKEIVAKSIHFNSPRKTGPFVVVNCAAIPETLIESELFGHERGAFTGASVQRSGQFERAHGGTIFLDEIGDMSSTLQAKLLRILEDREVQRVGGTSDVPVDIRVIAATNKDLKSAVEADLFRADLFHRLAAFPLILPPLRERREDIPLLAAHFLKASAENANNSVRGISPAALQELLAYDWPGNVRELKNVIERAVLLETTDHLKVGNLSFQFPAAISARTDPGSPVQALLSLEETERQALVRALEATEQNITRAARILNVGRTTLYRKLNKYNLLAEK